MYLQATSLFVRTRDQSDFHSSQTLLLASTLVAFSQIGGEEG
jgi:hypothetical protein